MIYPTDRHIIRSNLPWVSGAQAQPDAPRRGLVAIRPKAELRSIGVLAFMTQSGHAYRSTCASPNLRMAHSVPGTSIEAGVEYSGEASTCAALAYATYDWVAEIGPRPSSDQGTQLPAISVMCRRSED